MATRKPRKAERSAQPSIPKTPEEQPAEKPSDATAAAATAAAADAKQDQAEAAAAAAADAAQQEEARAAAVAAAAAASQEQARAAAAAAAAAAKREQARAAAAAAAAAKREQARAAAAAAAAAKREQARLAAAAAAVAKQVRDAKDRRLALIRRIEKARGSHLISYVTSTRGNIEVQMAMDSVRRVYDHLTAALKRRRKKKLDKIDLFLHSNGGDGTVPWRLVTLIREYTDNFCVLVPHRAFSAATLTALGADSIVMHPMGMLGPTDPTVANQFNPQDPTNPQQRLGISSEDVTAYIALIKEDAGIQHEDELVTAFNKLADHVHPLALGNVKRFLSQSRMMARKLLCLHMDVKKEEHLIEEIVDSFTSKLFYHGHPINRSEARDQLGLKTIQFPSESLETAMWELYLEYEKQIKLETPFDVAAEFVSAFPKLTAGAQEITPSQEAKLVYVESADRTDLFRIQYQLSGQRLPNGSTNVLTIINSKRWTTE